MLDTSLNFPYSNATDWGYQERTPLTEDEAAGSIHGEKKLLYSAGDRILGTEHQTTRAVKEETGTNCPFCTEIADLCNPH